MITEDELFTALTAIVGEVERAEISVAIAIRDITRAFRIFEQQTLAREPRLDLGEPR